MRIVFLGSGAFGLPTLSALCDAHEVPLVVTQPDRPAGRKRQLTPTDIARFADERGITVTKPEKINDESIVQQIADAKPDAIVVIAFGQKVGDRVIELPSHGRIATMNLHASLLPKYRGAAPINWAILRGETVTGNTVFSLVDKMDAGDILGSQTMKIAPTQTAGEVHDQLAAMGPQLVLDVLSKLEAGKLEPQPQDESKATVAPKLSRADGSVDFRTPAKFVQQHVHGLTPWPGVSCWWANPGEKQRHQLWLRRVEAMPAGRLEAPIGTMVTDGLIAVGQNAIRLIEVQLPGKRQMTWEEFQRGHQLAPGTMFYSSAE